MGLLDNRTAIITGASSGVGLSAALLFASQGANLVISGRRQDALADVASRVADAGGRAEIVVGDVTEPSVHVRMVTRAMDAFGRLDIAFNNAGWLGETGSAHEVTLDGWRKTIDVNLTGHFIAAKAQLPAMAKAGGGSMIFTSTFVGHLLGFPGLAAYGAAKAGLVGLMRVIAVEYAGQNIRANALLPGGIDTPMGDAATGSPEALDFVKSLHAMKRIAMPDEIAQTALYLASNMSSFVTGSTLVVDGGVTMNRT